MRIEETKLQGCYILYPQIFRDERGYFFESFNKARFESLTGASGEFLQDNQSFSTFGTIRGLHFQKGEWAQAKLVRAIEGVVLDVAVDLRPESATFGQWVAVRLDAEQQNQLYIPRGFAHGFSVLSPKAIFAYKCDNFYNKGSEGGIIYNDATLGIDWQVPAESVQLSEKDRTLPQFMSLTF